MPNQNCLEGMNCPKCGAEEPFKILVESIVTMYDNGSEDQEHAEWGPQSYCECKKCGHFGRAWQFTISSREAHKVKRTKGKNLPLLIGTLKTEEGQEALIERLKNVSYQN